MNKKISFTFDGKKYFGFEGDTLASALIRNGVFLVARSFKYHRPRGVISAGSEEPNALIQLELNEITEPNVRATEVEIYEGLNAASQNNWPTLNFDFGSINDLLSPFFPAGFYYKTFMWPSKFWEKYEYFIRRAAGLGKSPTQDDPHQYEHFHYHCDVLIVGGGISGLYAAKLARKTNLKVLVIEQNSELGGQFITADLFNTHKTLVNKLEEQNNKDNLKIIKNTTVFAYLHSNYLLACQKINHKKIRQIIWKIRAKKVVLATGSIERFLTFDNNDRPGIMLANSAHKFINHFFNNYVKKIIFFTNNDTAYQSAIDFYYKKELEVEAIIDVRKNSDGDLVKKAKELGIKIFFNYAVIDTKGRKKINSVIISQLNDSFDKVIGKSKKLHCDLLCVSGGWTPTVHLFSQSKGKLLYRELDATFIPNKSFQKEISIGACNGTFELDEILQETHKKMANLLAEFGTKIDKEPRLKSERVFYDKLKHIWIVPSKKHLGKTKMFVDFQNDVTVKDIKLALKEGYRSIEHIKRYTTTGMATDQGKIGNINALGIISNLTGIPVHKLGTTTFRLPYTPIAFGALAGRHIKEFFDVNRTTPIHQWHIDHGAKFEDVGQWKRAWYYPKENEDMHKAVNREVKATRDGIGIFGCLNLR